MAALKKECPDFDRILSDRETNPHLKTTDIDNFNDQVKNVRNKLS